MEVYSISALTSSWWRVMPKGTPNPESARYCASPLAMRPVPGLPITSVSSRPIKARSLIQLFILILLGLFLFRLVLGNKFLGDVGRHLFIVAELHGIATPPLGY